jgi:hypothetical protein
MIELKPGSRWKSAVCDTQVVIVRPPGSPVAALACGGAPMAAYDAEPHPGVAIDPAWASGSVAGKRYIDAGSGLELLCSKGGAGGLTVDGRQVSMKDTKKLPASD